MCETTIEFICHNLLRDLAPFALFTFWLGPRLSYQGYTLNRVYKYTFINILRTNELLC